MQWYYKEKFDADQSWSLKGYTVQNNPNSPNHYPFVLRILFTFFALFTDTYHIQIMLRAPQYNQWLNSSQIDELGNWCLKG